MIDWVNVCHAILNNAAHFLQSFEWAHGGYGVSLNEDVCAGKKLKSFQGRSIGSENTLSAFHEALFIVDQAADFDYVTCDAVFQDFEGLPKLSSVQPF